MNKEYITDDIKILTGAEAEEAFRNDNDQKYLKDEAGIIKVSKDRWEKAQRTEYKHWFRNGLKIADDRNFYHALQFENYNDLEGKEFSNAIELGCGPFTNIRIMATKCHIKIVTLLDPLINNYLSHPFCAYDKKHLYSDRNSILRRIVKKYFPKVYKYYRNIASSKIEIKEFISKPLEEIVTSIKYDLVIMINVLEHCYDIERIFENILKITSVGGYFVFSDKLLNYDEILQIVGNKYDAAHPIRINKTVIDKFLLSNFEIAYKRVQTNINYIKGEDLYFIGIRK